MLEFITFSVYAQFMLVLWPCEGISSDLDPFQPEVLFEMNPRSCKAALQRSQCFPQDAPSFQKHPALGWGTSLGRGCSGSGWDGLGFCWALGVGPVFNLRV